ncbi:YicC/YloC family endoribonuclease [Pseudomaricurvus sp. HS19]|uniref:YicC/YloC family endoribonuclease n=1 Tax=Pseudomaricurvus sp. HS19 TaxID=2692626 RepID=UPI00136F0BA4|nr:YicC/YloC family endoribonuclease [Pseudomaricurvus sp. HS19]MYM63845.1 YicC family protein [Pseudomaricurvus sp. HS19]
MPCSMTGFARQEANYPWGTLVWEVRSVNHRYLEPHLRLPELVRELEPAVREEMRKQLSRGKVEASFTYQLSGDSSQTLTVNESLLQQLSQALQHVDQQLPNPAPVSPLDVLRWPGMIGEYKIDREAVLEAALELFKKALAGLIDHRAREGAELQQLIETRLDGISEQVVQVRAMLPTILQSQRQRLLDKLTSIKAELDQDRLEQEMVYLAQKSDVDEELDRLDTHVTEVRRTLKQKGAVGRRLDFLMQELNREANTLSSKSIVSETTQAAVELKVLIEQMREQVQNIE